MTVEDAAEYFVASEETLLKVYRQHSPLHQQRAVSVMDQIGQGFIADNVAESQKGEVVSIQLIENIGAPAAMMVGTSF